MSGKNLPGGLIRIRDNADGTQSYVFDKFCIFEKGYINSIYNPLTTLSKPGTTVPVFNYGITNGVLFDFTDNNGDSITVNQSPVTGNYALTFPAINTNDTLVTTNLAQTLTNKTLTSPALTNATLSAPIFSGSSSGLIQNSSQYCFEAYLSTAQSGVTGTGNTYTVIFDKIAWQIGSGYSSSTGVFTAPVAGLYKFNTSVVIFDLVSTNTFVGLSFAINSSGNAFVFLGNQVGDTQSYMVVSGSRIFNMIAGDTISVSVTVNGTSGSNNASVSGGQYGTWFQMHLLTSYV